MASGYSCRNAAATIYGITRGDLVDRLQEWPRITYAVIGSEICPDSQRPHLQCYFEFKGSMEQKTFTNRCGVPIHEFKSRYKYSSAERASAYCKKGKQSKKEWETLNVHGDNYGLDAEFSEWGEITHQGKRTDLGAVIDDIKDGMSEREISLKHVSIFCHSMKWVQRMLELHSNVTEHAEYPLEEMCERVQQNPIPWDDPGWCGSAIVQGGPGIGKTQYALAHFENPLFVTHMDRLKFFDPNFHDGIVFDDMCFTHMPLQAQKYLLDWNNSRDMNVKYGMATIPKYTKKIFTCNYDEFPFEIMNTAIVDRIYHLQCDRSLESHRRMPTPQPYVPVWQVPPPP